MAQVVEIPVATVAANFLDDIARIREVGMADRLVAIGDGRVYDAGIRARWERGELLTLGHAFHAGGDTEQLLVADPDLFLADLIHLLHPGRLPDHELIFFGPVELTKRDAP